MKKLVSLLLVLMMVCACIPVMAEETPEGYPEVMPGIDFGGQKIWIYDYFSSSSNERKAEPTEEEQAQYDYRDWIMKTYNCEIEQIAENDWGNIATDLTNFCQAGDANKSTLTIWQTPPDFILPLAQNQFLAPWNNNDLVDITDEDRWNPVMNEFMNVKGNVYGVFPGIDAHGSTEPRQMLFFNKPLLEASGIDCETIYDMQADGTWTWDAFEEMLAKIQKDSDNDGTIDIWGMTGSNMDMYRVAVLGNGGSFFEMDHDTGEISITATSQETLDALSWSKHILETYFFQGVADENGNAPQWDYYKNAWNDGKYGFYIYQAYGAFNDVAEMDNGPEWGVVAFPKGPGENGRYVTIANDNPVVVPAIYDAETIRNLQYIYSLWAAPTPGFEDSENWKTSRYLKASDDRAVDETYAMLMKCGVFDPVLNLGATNDVEGQDYLYNLSWQTPQEITEAKMPSWEGLVKTYNEKYATTAE